MVHLVGYLNEALWLWIGTAIVVTIASLVHYAIASGEHEDLKNRIERQTAKAQPEYRRMRSE